MRRKKFQKPDDGPVPLTEAGLKRLQKRLAELKASIPGLAAEASEAAAQGDRSDNDAYKQSKGLLRRTHRQIWTLEDQIKRAQVIQPGRNAAGTVQLGSEVTLETGSGERRTFQIVGPRETNPERGRISHVSPLGAALMSHAEGHEILVATAAGKRKYKILKVA